MSAKVGVRGAGPQDAPAVEAVLNASYSTLMAAGYPADLLVRALPLMVRANPKLLSSGTYYIAEVPGGGAVGCGGWTLERPGAADAPIDPALGHIRHFATHPHWTRRGVGRELFQRCTADARARGVRRFECYSSLVAEDFYRALGFVAVERKTVPMGPGIDFSHVVMVCELGSGC